MWVTTAPRARGRGWGGDDAVGESEFTLLVRGKGKGKAEEKELVRIVTERIDHLVNVQGKKAVQARRSSLEAALLVKKRARKTAEVANKATAKELAARMQPKDGSEKKESIDFKDAVGRKFQFPLHLVSTWKGIETLISCAFLPIPTLAYAVQEGHYDLVGPDNTIILPQVWESVIEP
ncbi:uncharacterized protein BDR25DRAFT_241914, partial [Lindgomyces ingoldianus]